MARHPRAGDSVMYITVTDEQRLILSPAIITAVKEINTASLFIMFEKRTQNIQDLPRGGADGQWCYPGEFGI